jgi:hypothetical protein
MTEPTLTVGSISVGSSDYTCHDRARPRAAKSRLRIVTLPSVKS